MGSPFPGMDPYIEVSHLWEDFHNKLIGEIERALSARVPDRYVVRTPERSYIALAESEGEDDERSFAPDVAVASRRKSAKTTRKSKRSAGGLAVHDAPGSVMMRALVKAEYREPFLEIRQVDPEHKLVTGIEVLSPSNKRPEAVGVSEWPCQLCRAGPPAARPADADGQQMAGQPVLSARLPQKAGAALFRLAGVLHRAAAAGPNPACAA